MNHFFLGSSSGLCPSLHHYKSYSFWGLLVSQAIWPILGPCQLHLYPLSRAQCLVHLSIFCMERIKRKLVMLMCFDTCLISHV